MNLEERVNAYNKACKAGNAYYPQLRAAFEPFVGKQVIRATGGLMAKVQVAIDALNLPYSGELRIQRQLSEYDLAYYVIVPGFPNEIKIQIGNLQDNVLTKLADTCELKEKTVAEVVTAREEWQKAKRVVSHWENEMYPFGTYDH